MTRKRKSSGDWRAKAKQVGALLPSVRLHPAALAWIGKDRTRGPWCVAFSGGADSLALLLLVWALWPERRDRLVALHFNHRLRGRAADTDARFCQQVCRGLGVKCVVGEWKLAHRPQVASEADARAARHEFFGREMKRLGARTLWLAHQQDDIAETMLMRLSRGSGTAGMAAPRPVQAMPGGRVHVRPLLTVKKSDLIAALQKAGAPWREDATNVDGDYFRNRVRRAVLPAWTKASGRDALAGAALTRERLEEDDAAIEAWLDELRPLEKQGVLQLRRLAGKPRAVLRRALHRWLVAVRPNTDLSRQGFEQLLAAIERGRDTRFSLGVKGFAVLRRTELKFRLD